MFAKLVFKYIKYFYNRSVPCPALPDICKSLQLLICNQQPVVHICNQHLLNKGFIILVNRAARFVDGKLDPDIHRDDIQHIQKTLQRRQPLMWLLFCSKNSLQKKIPHTYGKSWDLNRRIMAESPPSFGIIVY